MGFHNIWGKAEIPKGHSKIASRVIFQSMTRGQIAFGRKNTEIRVSVIGNLSKVYHSTRKGWLTRWIHKLGLL